MKEIPSPGRVRPNHVAIRRFRILSGLSQAELADGAGIRTTKTISRIESGRPAYVQSLKRIAEVLRVELSQIILSDSSDGQDLSWREMHPDCVKDYIESNLGIQRLLRPDQPVRLITRCPTLRVLTESVMKTHLREQLSGLREIDPLEADRLCAAHEQLWAAHRGAFLGDRIGSIAGPKILNVIARSDFNRMVLLSQPYSECHPEEIAGFFATLDSECFPRRYALLVVEDRVALAMWSMQSFDTIATVGEQLAVRRTLWDYQIEWSPDQDRHVRRHLNLLTPLLKAARPVELAAYRAVLDKLIRMLRRGSLTRLKWKSVAKGLLQHSGLASQN